MADSAEMTNRAKECWRQVFGRWPGSPNKNEFNSVPPRLFDLQNKWGGEFILIESCIELPLWFMHELIQESDNFSQITKRVVNSFIVPSLFANKNKGLELHQTTPPYHQSQIHRVFFRIVESCHVVKTEVVQKVVQQGPLAWPPIRKRGSVKCLGFLRIEGSKSSL